MSEDGTLFSTSVELDVHFVRRKPPLLSKLVIKSTDAMTFDGALNECR